MRRKWLTALLVTSVVLVMAAPAWAQVPNPGTGNINIILQNIDGTQDAVIEVSYLGQDGTEVYSSNHSLAPYVSTEIRVADIQDTVPPILGDGWLGTAVVSSSTRGASVGSAYWTGGGEGDGKTAGAYNGFSSGSTTVYLPYIFHVSSRASVFSVQNISEDTTANITIHYLDRATGNEVATVTDTIVPKGQKTYDLIAQTPADKIPDPVKGDFEGAVYIESNVPIAAVSQTHWRFFSSIYNGLSAGDTTLYFPQVVRVRREDGTWVRWSTLLIQNITNSNVTVTVRIYDANGNEKVNFTDTVGPKCAAGYNTRFKGDIPDNVFNNLENLLGTRDFTGSAVITSSAPNSIVGISHIQYFRPKMAFTYSAFRPAEGTKALAFPDVYNMGSTRWTAIIVQNLGDTDAHVDAYFFTRDAANGGLGNEALHLENLIIPPMSRIGLNTRFDASVPASSFDPLGENWSGSAVIISSDQNIVGMCSNMRSNPRQAEAYNAVNFTP